MGQSEALNTKSFPNLINQASIRMYCMGTGDFFLIRFSSGSTSQFSMVIDCGSCYASKKHMAPFVENMIQSLHQETIDLLVVTHEHNDHVNGFDKCLELFECITFKEAWFAWTEQPDDPTGWASQLKSGRRKIRSALSQAIECIERSPESSLPFGKNFLSGLKDLASINLSENVSEDGTLPGMKKLKELLHRKKVNIKYLFPGETIKVPALPGLLFHILGPPGGAGYIFKHAREGKDVLSNALSITADALAADTLFPLNTQEHEPLFNKKYQIRDAPFSEYFANGNSWRRIDNDWIGAAGGLAIRLNSHINNTSLVIAIESEASGKVLLFPGDAEFGSWLSWHEIQPWMARGKGGKPLAEDLLSRTIFYKVSHHLSFNGTPTAKGLDLMTHPDLVAMATLDRSRIMSRWLGTMPSKNLLNELIRKTSGNLVLMENNAVVDEKVIDKLLVHAVDEQVLFKEYTIRSW